ncbi:[LysW]-lysine hydrolase [Haladaptatus sp. DJG-WS-42]|uniref:[LysW]-lysine hydrolase n=1 Tax=Haladaptatus sp. DJG-WS-42 TaxID=3120516 RepID=UPI0030CFC3F4
MTDAQTLLSDLVSIPSVSGDEAAAAERLAAYFEEHDREVWIDEVGNVRAPADDSVLLTSHIDTVPGEIPVEIAPAEDGSGDALWGRGSVDATGPLASMAAAAVSTGVSFVGVVREETDSLGARHLVETRETVPDTVINGEPSGWNGITLGYRGFLPGTYIATSESGHTSRPENNALQDAIAWWSAVAEDFSVPEDTPVFEQVTAKPTDFHGGTSEDGLAVEATATIQFRIPPSLTADDIREIAESHLHTGTITWRRHIPPVMMSPRTAVARAFRVAIRAEDGTPRLLRKTGTSDMNIFAGEWDCPMVTYGPGDSDLDHAPNEHLPLAEYDRAVSVLEAVCKKLKA